MVVSCGAVAAAAVLEQTACASTTRQTAARSRKGPGAIVGGMGPALRHPIPHSTTSHPAHTRPQRYRIDAVELAARDGAGALGAIVCSPDGKGPRGRPLPCVTNAEGTFFADPSTKK